MLTEDPATGDGGSAKQGASGATSYSSAFGNASRTFPLLFAPGPGLPNLGKGARRKAQGVKVTNVLNEFSVSGTIERAER